MQMPIGWNGLSMSTNVCSVCMPIGRVNFKIRGLHNTYFSFQNNFYEQVDDVAMGSPVSPIAANLYMEYFEKKALCSASTPEALV